jgi:hypothetical protein
MLLAGAISLGPRLSWAQLAPDPRMLLDLDLFASNSNGEAGADQNSMLEQIQTLRAMGYLNNAAPPPPQSVLTIPPPPPAVRNEPPPADTEDQVTE